METESIDSTPATRELDAKGIPYRFFRHPGPVHSLTQAAQERGQRPEQVIRSILFRLEMNTFILVLMAGPGQISWPKLRKYLNQSRLTMATKEEVLQSTGYLVGSVSPFGLPKPIRTLVDLSVLDQVDISIGSGERGTTIFMKTNDLMKALGDVEVNSFETESPNPG